MTHGIQACFIDRLSQDKALTFMYGDTDVIEREYECMVTSDIRDNNRRAPLEAPSKKHRIHQRCSVGIKLSRLIKLSMTSSN